MEKDMTLTVIEPTPLVGAEIRTDKQTLLSGQHAGELRSLLEKRSVVFARGLDFSDEDLRTGIEMFGRKTSRGAFIVNMVLCGCAAYRTQLFLYLKSCGREELSTWKSHAA